MKQITNKIKDGILVGVGIMLVFGITSLSYAAYSWITQTSVAGGETLTATKWNDMLNNQNYLKENTETKMSKAGDTMSGPINMGTNKITNLGVPVASTDAATKSYADSVSASGEGQYQITCTNYKPGDNYGIAVMCLRIDTITGLTDCKYSLDTTIGATPWGNCSYNPW